ncbi:MAG: helicase-related protein [Pseudomonadota bacterium]
MRFSPSNAVHEEPRITAILGPTNTGKTHYAIERMLAYPTGMIGLPLRLLAREVYDRVVKARGRDAVALVTGEEKIIPEKARYWVATVEAMPLDRDVDFVAIDEVQLAADPERGRIFTSRLMAARGAHETLFLGADTMRPLINRLFGRVSFDPRARFSQLTYSGVRKVTRLPRRTAIVAFSAATVYEIAELIRRQRGGAAVVLGALSPRTRNAQAALYQSGDVDFLVATDAIGMGLNMDIDHVAFAAQRKFDGRRTRNLTHAEIAQIAGRAGRHVRDGSFGVTADCPPLDEEAVAAIEDHSFEPVRALQWRSDELDFSSLDELTASLETRSPRPEFVRARRGDDENALRALTARGEIRDAAQRQAEVALLWDVCQIPDFRKVSGDQHARLLGDVFLLLSGQGRIDDGYIAPKITQLDRTDGNIDAISARIAHIRTWTYLSHRQNWLENPAYWQDKARAIEDKLSDALHEKLTQRFVDRRTATLLRRLKDDTPLLAGVTEDGEVIVEGQFIGRLLGFEFIIDPRAHGAEAKSLRAAGERALRPILAARAAALANASTDDLELSKDGAVRWRGGVVATLAKGPAPLRPLVTISGLDAISSNMRGRVEDRLREFVVAKLEAGLAPLISLNAAVNQQGDKGLDGLAKGVAFRLVENFGAASRTLFGDDLKQLDQNERSKLRKIGVRFGEVSVFIPALLKPAPAKLLSLLWALWTDRPIGALPQHKPGLVSIPLDENIPHAYYYASGYRPSGTRAVRIDMIERLAGLVRTARSEADMREGFEATAQMMSIVGCSGEDFDAIMRSLGLRKQLVKRKAPTPVKAEAMAEGAPKPEQSTEESAPESAAVGQAQQSSANTEPTPQNTETSGEDATAISPEQPSSNDNGEAQRAVEAPSDAPSDAENAQAPKEGASSPAVSDETTEEIEVALWRPAPRKRPPQKKRDTSPNGEKRARTKQSFRKGAKAPAKNQNNNRRPPRRREPDPDSPFAVLADLKSQLSGQDDKGAKSKATEKTE